MRLGLPIACAFATSVLLAGLAGAQGSAAVGPDRVEALQAGLKDGKVQLQRSEGRWGYLPALLKALDIPIDSQVLVFSKTSLQFDEISPQTPRAIYFNDDTAVGAVQGGRVFEVVTAGADGKIAFYTLDTKANDHPAFERQDVLCLSCHATVDRWAPGMIVANVIPMENGAPLYVTVDKLFDMTDATTPFDERWGGWYVEGQAGAMRHRGNVHSTPENPGELDPDKGQNLTDLSSRVDVKPYLAQTSDIVALMTLEHQLGVMNRIWRLQGQQHALAIRAAKVPTPAEVDQTVEDFVAYLVGAHEAPLPSPVTGVSSFTETFPKRGPRDSHGRSLRDFDLQTRLFRYPLSYMIYSRAFDGLDPEIRERIYRRLYEVLSGADASPAYARISPEGRKAALEILRETKPDLPAYFRAGAAGRS